MNREWNTTAGIKRKFRTQYVINDNGFIRTCTARYQSKRATEDSQSILTVDYSAVLFLLCNGFSVPLFVPLSIKHDNQRR